MRSKISFSELRDRVILYPITGYNDVVTGVPKRTFSATGTTVYAKVRRSIASDPTAPSSNSNLRSSSDKTKVVYNVEVTVRIDNVVYNVEDKIIWDNRTMYIKDIKQIDIWFQNLICFDEY